mmetsp:Transcript_5548/g.15486  ORF Transcript_5548/g.15486 Transcript_5548/m.15486 type:complete len:232 (-) Transcript_5548:414-1109(-)
MMPFPPTLACSLVLRVSRGCSTKVEDPDATAPARAAVMTTLAVVFCGCGGAKGTIVADSNQVKAGSRSDWMRSSGRRMRKFRNFPYEMRSSGEVSKARNMDTAFSSVAGRPIRCRDPLMPLSSRWPSGASSSIVKAFSMSASRSSISSLTSSHPTEEIHHRLRRARFMKSRAYSAGRFRRLIAALTSASVTRPSRSLSSSSKNLSPSSCVYLKKSCTVMRRLLVGWPEGVT